MDREATSRARDSKETTPLDWLQAQLAKRPEDSGLWYGKGVLLVNEGALEKALAAFDKALWLDPRHVKALEAKAKALFRLERYLEAYDSFRRLTREVPRDEEYWYYSGESLSKLGHHLKALSYYDKALGLNPDYTDALYGKANALKEAQDAGKAAEAVSGQSRGDVPSDDGKGPESDVSGPQKLEVRELRRRAESAMYNEDYERALALYDEVLEVDKEESRAWEGKGLTLARLSRFSEAAKCYEEALRERPGETHIWLAKGKALREDGKFQDALRSLEEAVRVDPGNLEAVVEMKEIRERLEEGGGEAGPDVGVTLHPEQTEAPTFATYLDPLDSNMGGGVTPGSITLVTGMPGTFKTSLCFWILYQQAIREGTKGLYITLEQSKNSLLRHVVALGLNPAAVATDLRVLDLAKYRLRFRPKESSHQWLEILEHKIQEVQGEGVEVIVLDSLGALALMADFQDRRKEIFRLFTLLRNVGMTSFVISERYEVPYKGRFLRVYDVEDFLSDGIIELSLREREGGELQRALRVEKMRDREHLTSLHFLYWDEGFKLVQALAAPPPSS